MSLKKAAHFLDVMTIMGIPAQMKLENAPAYVYKKMKKVFFAYYDKKCIIRYTTQSYRSGSYRKKISIHKSKNNIRYLVVNLNKGIKDLFDNIFKSFKKEI